MTDLSPEVLASIKSKLADATIAATDGGWTLIMSREFAHPASRVWEMITPPELLQQWSPVVPDRLLTSTGPATAREDPTSAPVDVEVLASEAPQLLVHRWGPHTLRWTVMPTPARGAG
ncbi:MAG TPA: SRPBCC domain-containing protein [Micromonospora sp.]|nr:SRPBCC domain-containing protein [Micromonospora sp.]